jgi:hypothetical protein
MPMRGFPRIPPQVIATQSISGSTLCILHPVYGAHVPMEPTSVLEDSNLRLRFSNKSPFIESELLRCTVLSPVRDGIMSSLVARQE